MCDGAEEIGMYHVLVCLKSTDELVMSRNIIPIKELVDQMVIGH